MKLRTFASAGVKEKVAMRGDQKLIWGKEVRRKTTYGRKNMNNLKNPGRVRLRNGKTEIASVGKISLGPVNSAVRNEKSNQRG